MEHRELFVAHIVNKNPHIATSNTAILIAVWEHLLGRPIDEDLKEVMYRAKPATLLRIKPKILYPSADQKKLQEQAINTFGGNIIND